MMNIKLKAVLHRTNLVVGFVIILLVVLVAIFAPWLAPTHPWNDADLMVSELPPSSEYLLGTDTKGRDILSRVIYGSRVSLAVGVISQLINSLIGVLLGLIAGYYGNKCDDIIMGVANIMLSVPSLIFALAVMAVLGPGLLNVFIALGLTNWVYTCRITRSQVLGAKNKNYIKAAHALGFRKTRIMFFHILPNIIGPILVIATLGMADAILMEASLSFLGLGTQPPIPSWGGMLAGTREQIFTSPWLSIFPGAAIFITVLGLNLLGDGLRDFLDPHSSQKK